MTSGAKKKKSTIKIGLAVGLLLAAGVVYFLTSRPSESGPNPVLQPEVQDIVSQLAEEEIPDDEQDYDEEFEVLAPEKVEPGSGRRAGGPG